MAQLYFYYSAMNAGKSTALLQSSYNYQERGMRTLVFTAEIDHRFGMGKVSSRIGPSSLAQLYNNDSMLYTMISQQHQQQPVHCVLLDESQFLTKAQVEQLCELSKGDFGPSFKYKDYSVNDLVASSFPVSAKLGLAAFLLAVVEGVSAGVVAALKQNTLWDYTVMGLAMTGVVIPSFVVALLPVLSYMGPAFVGIITGSMVIETIYGLPGIGQLFVNGALNRDYSLVLSLTILFNAIVDMLYAVIDPKIRY